MFVVLEGMDFAGKSTIAGMVADRLRERGRKVHHQRTCYIEGGVVGNLVQRTQDWAACPSELKSAMFIGSSAADGLLWRWARRSKPGVVLQESYFDRTLVWHAVHEKHRWVSILRAIYPLLPTPQLRIYLDCSLSQRASRYRQSGSLDPRDKARFGIGRSKYAALSRAMRRFAKHRGYLLLCTEQRSPKEIADDIANKIIDAGG